MKLKSLIWPPKPLVGAALAILSGLVILQMSRGERWGEALVRLWVHTSYDGVFFFGSRPATNQASRLTNEVIIVVLEKEAYDPQGQTRPPWDRRLHTKLLNRLAADGCALIVMDVLFDERPVPGPNAVDEALAVAMSRQRKIVLSADKSAPALGNRIDSVSPIPPPAIFEAAAKTNWGVAAFDPDLDNIVRRHWPFGESASFESLPAAVASAVGAHWDTNRLERWLRYYGERGPGTILGYDLALEAPPNFFRDKIVFFGSRPDQTSPEVPEEDKFRTPYTRWQGRSVGGVEILATAFLNLANGDWLRRFHPLIEVLVLMLTGALLAFVLYRLRPLLATVFAATAALAVIFAGVSLSYFTNYWFPYLVIAGAQLPCALAWKLVISWRPRPVTKTVIVRGEGAVAPVANIPDYELIEPPFGEGAYGKVWLARNAVGQWQAFKSVYLAKFQNNADPYEREFNGIKRYKPISDKHPGLLRVDFVSRQKQEGYFYYVMELADSLTPGWEQNPTLYKPRDLANVRNEAPGRRLPLDECVSISVALAEALDFLHRQKLTHRDIKPSNILFVSGRPKLGDVGLVSDLKPPSPTNTLVGTLPYMPPAPEPPGTAQADIFGLGMVLYVISTGHEPDRFPELSEALVRESNQTEFLEWNQIVLKACHPDRTKRYVTTAELLSDLSKLKSRVEAHRAKRIPESA